MPCHTLDPGETFVALASDLQLFTRNANDPETSRACCSESLSESRRR
jgi:hypothetical protein